ncbi:unnamed protein product, partial [Heterosigma akashiwo]
GSFGTYFSHKIQKLQHQFIDDASQIVSSGSGPESSIFHNVVVHVNGLTNPPQHELRRLINQHGGQMDGYETSRVTHYICNNLPDAKKKELRKLRKPPIVVTASWVVESIKAKTLLSTAPFLVGGLHRSQESVLKSKHTTRTGKSNLPDQVSLPPPDNASGDWAGKHFSLDEENLEGECFNNESNKDGHGETHEEECSRENSAGNLDDPDGFIETFFKWSRLHHIGHWKMHYQKRAANRQRWTGVDLGALRAAHERTILHVDMDCFFVSVVVRGRPDLEGKPVAVAHSGHGGGSSEVSSCNYPARAKGVKAGMFMQTAKQLCPELVVLPYDFKLYEEVSDRIYDLFFETAPLVQAQSCDEAYLQLSAEDHAAGRGAEVARRLRARILAETGCPASAGIGPSILLARLATKQAKPNGQRELTPTAAAAWLAPLPAAELPGVGWKLARRLEARGLRTCGDLAAQRPADLRQWYGERTGALLAEMARGRDARPLEGAAPRKSVGADVNYGMRFTERAEVERFLRQLCAEVGRRLVENGVAARAVTLKVKKKRPGAAEPAKFMGHGACDNLSRSFTFAGPVADGPGLYPVVRRLYAGLGVTPEETRGIGISGSKLVPLKKAENPREGDLGQWLVKTTAPDPAPAQQGTASKDDSADEHDPNTFSQMDPTVFESLPNDIQEELVSA